MLKILPRCVDSMNPYLKHTLFAVTAGFWIDNHLQLEFWPGMCLGLILAVCARALSLLETPEAQ